jgi:hypothetical protein
MPGGVKSGGVRREVSKNAVVWGKSFSRACCSLEKQRSYEQRTRLRNSILCLSLPLTDRTIAEASRQRHDSGQAT